MIYVMSSDFDEYSEYIKDKKGSYYWIGDLLDIRCQTISNLIILPKAENNPNYNKNFFECILPLIEFCLDIFERIQSFWRLISECKTN